MISENQWVEVVKYQKELDEEKILKEKQLKEKKKLHVKVSLE